jgi:metal-responsive CopG/Arc/MetJ family transcriptional regulator
MSEKELVFVGIKMPRPLLALVDEAVTRGTHATRSELIRDAIRKELQCLRGDETQQDMDSLYCRQDLRTRAIGRSASR